MNDELHRLYEADVWEHRQGYASGSAEYRTMRERDRQRRARAEDLIESHALTAPEDYFHAARLFQHGDTAED
ncbi:MAG TPA: hypothetical protein VEZ12_12605, partial [Herpetosiphonaceae bacterium]|nr:hypothetical protein [Herpetosiphonaceae bacterium]